MFGAFSTAALLAARLAFGPEVAPAEPADLEAPAMESPVGGAESDAGVPAGEDAPAEGAATVENELPPDAEPEPEQGPDPEPETEREEVPEPPLGPDPVPIDEPSPLDADAGYDPRRDSPEAIRARGWLRSGIVATSAGVVLGVVAVVMGTLDPCAPKGGNNCFEDSRSRSALTIAIPAAALLAGGVAMTVVGARRLKRIKLAAVGSRGEFGLVLSGRF